jgi:hypothetical protein
MDESCNLIKLRLGERPQNISPEEAGGRPERWREIEWHRSDKIRIPWTRQYMTCSRIS